MTAKGGDLMKDPERFQPQDFGIGRLFWDIAEAIIVANAASERIVLWNPAAATIFGYSESEALDLPLHALVPDTLKERHRRGLASYQETGRGTIIGTKTPLLLPAVVKGGAEIDIELSLNPVDRPLRDDPRFVLAVIRDATQRKRAEDYQLRLREAEFRQQQAIELNDTVVQGLAVAKMALDAGDAVKAREVIDSTLVGARAIVSTLLSAITEGRGIRPGDLRRDRPASLEPPDD